MLADALAIIEDECQRNELSEFYEKNKDRFYAIAFEHLHNREESEDAVQEAFLRIADKPDKFFSLYGTKRIGYACMIIRNISIDMYNRCVKNIGIISEEYAESEDYDFLDNSLLDKISRDEILSFIDNLPELQHNVIVLTCLSGLSISETAQTLKISKNAVNQRLYLARKSIKDFIEERNKINE